MHKEKGFTVIELIVVIVILLTVGGFFLLQRADLATTIRDKERKIAVNSLYLVLTEVYYPEHKSYPAAINLADLKSLDPELFLDSHSINLSDGSTDNKFSYEGTNCDNENRCKSFKLSVTLEKEALYTKQPD
jgi:prepilin-type N-terminal cleavage/methylation domain-containing protein